jgi:hypothetical protein
MALFQWSLARAQAPSASVTATAPSSTSSASATPRVEPVRRKPPAKLPSVTVSTTATIAEASSRPDAGESRTSSVTTTAVTMSDAGAASTAPRDVREVRAPVAVKPAATQQRSTLTTETAPTAGVAATTTSTQSTSEAPQTQREPTIGVTYLNRPVFLITNDGSKNARERAKRLTEALKAAIEAGEKATPESPNVELLPQQPPALELRVRGYVIGVLTQEDAKATKHPDLEAYAKSLDEGLELFVADQRRKIALQGFAVRVAITLLVSIGGLFLLRGAQALFRRADEYLDEHSSSLRPVRVLGVPVLGVEALGAALTFALAIGRILALASIAAVAIAIGLAQFETTRPWIAVIVQWSSERLLSAIEEFVLMLPRLFLAALLVLIGSAAVRVARVLFDDSTTTATPWGTVSRRRAKVLKFLIPVGVFVLIVPLAVAAVFGRFHTPLELLIIALVVGASLGLAPLVASGGMGLAATWHGTLQLGDHITVGQKSGRVSGVNPFWVNLESPSGELCSVPLLSLVNTAVIHRGSVSSERIELRVRRPSDIPRALETLRALAAEYSERVAVECLAFDNDSVRVAIDIFAEARQTAELVSRLANPQLEPAVLELTRKPYPDMVRGPS